MAKLRLRVELNKGRTGVPLEKFANVVGELKKFVEQLAREVGIPADKNEWFAHEFANGSGYFTSELAAVIETEKRALFNSHVRFLAELSSENKLDRAHVPLSLVEQFRKISDPLDFDEPIGFGIYESDAQDQPTWLQATKLSLASALDDVEFQSRYYGTVFGSVHSLHKGSAPAFLNVRDVVSGELIKCFYKPSDHYSAIAKLLQKDDALVYVHGLVTVDLVRKCIDHIDSDHFEVAPEYRPGDLDALIGAAPNFTGRMTTKQFIKKIRDDGRGA